jgi:nucleoid-associated protein YgaU
VAGAALLVSGALAILPTTGLISTALAEAKPAVTRPSETQRHDLLLAMVQTKHARVTQRDNTALLQSLLDEQLTPPQTRAAYAREMRLARAELAPGKKITIPAMLSTSSDAAQQQGTTYTVVAGDSLWTIAQKQWGDGTLWRAIYDANRETVGADPDLIYPNQKFTIPARPNRAGQPLPAPAPAPTPAPAPLPAGNYTIVSGDTLSQIALRRLGNADRWREIYTRNQGVIGANPNLIYPGTVLSLP